MFHAPATILFFVSVPASSEAQEELPETPPSATPTTPREESDSDEEEELPEGWERRVVGGAFVAMAIPQTDYNYNDIIWISTLRMHTHALKDSNGRAVFINHHHRQVSLRRPAVQQEREAVPPPRRAYLGRHTSIDVSTDYITTTIDSLYISVCITSSSGFIISPSHYTYICMSTNMKLRYYIICAIPGLYISLCITSSLILKLP